MNLKSIGVVMMSIVMCYIVLSPNSTFVDHRDMPLSKVYNAYDEKVMTEERIEDISEKERKLNDMQLGDLLPMIFLGGVAIGVVRYVIKGNGNNDGEGKGGSNNSGGGSSTPPPTPPAQ